MIIGVIDEVFLNDWLVLQEHKEDVFWFLRESVVQKHRYVMTCQYVAAWKTPNSTTSVNAYRDDLNAKY